MKFSDGLYGVSAGSLGSFDWWHVVVHVFLWYNLNLVHCLADGRFIPDHGVLRQIGSKKQGQFYTVDMVFYSYWPV